MNKIELVTGKNINQSKVEPVKDYASIEDRAQSLVLFLDTSNGYFAGHHKTAYALHDCQAKYGNEEYKPVNFFVVAENLIGAEGFFENRVIINPEILEIKDMIEQEVPVRKQQKVGDKMEIKLVMEKKKISNYIRVDEGCMSFPFRTAKKMQRAYTIKVRYQIPKSKILGFGSDLRTIEAEVTGLKAHIFQHEVGHAQGKNIFHDK